MQALISVIIPVHNHAEALRASLVSIEKQTYRDIEVVVVDDGSEEEIRNKKLEIDGILGNIPFVIYRQEHTGAPAARNKGFALSKGDYVIFWDADVIANPQMLEKMIHVLSIHPEASYVYSNFSFGKRPMPARKFDPEALKKNNYITTTSLIRREAVIAWDESLKRFQDWDMWLTLLEKEKQGIWIPEYLFGVIPRKKGMSRWLPSVAYKKPWCFLPWIRKNVRMYNKGKQIVMEKHGLK